MAAHNFEIDENIYYEYYMNKINCLALDSFLCDGINKFDTAILHCVYENGEIDKGKYISPIYKTITAIVDNKIIVGLKNNVKLICFK